jgi:hypothetical protein
MLLEAKRAGDALLAAKAKDETRGVQSVGGDELPVLLPIREAVHASLPRRV